MLGDLVAVETFLRNADNSNAGQAATNLEAGLACMDTVLPRMISGRAIRAIGAGFVASGDGEKGGSWLRTAAELEPSFEFGLEDLPETHPVREAYNQARSVSVEEAVVSGATLNSGGVVWLDGRKITEPKARPDRRHLLQYDTGGSIRSWTIEGNDFPDEVLAAAVAVTETKKPKKEPTVAAADAEKPPKLPKAPKTGPVSNNVAPVEIDRKRPWEKTPLMLGGAVIGLGAAGVYGLHLREVSKFNNLNEVDPLASQQAKANQLYVASFAILAVGAGTFTWGAIVDGSTPMPAVRIRF